MKLSQVAVAWATIIVTFLAWTTGAPSVSSLSARAPAALSAFPSPVPSALSPAAPSPSSLSPVPSALSPLAPSSVARPPSSTTPSAVSQTESLSESDGSGTNEVAPRAGPPTTTPGNPGGPRGPGMTKAQGLLRAKRLRNVHGVVALVAFVVLFPFGSVLVRVLPPGVYALWGHGVVQVVAVVLCVVCAGYAGELVLVVQGMGVDVTKNTMAMWHIIIGSLVLASLMFVQPVLGHIHHQRFKVLRRRQIWSHLHLWNGRVMVTLGIINAGLGIWAAKEGWDWKMSFMVLAVLMWTVWVLMAVRFEWKRARG
ncbi:hypothetical protein VTJ49DRAFT_2930 [Mycothermus thermophilus]|uniref:Cytochrome b561 domain-containing protein n=1 Tax=Humicola insolens TaxID=85995 RepID=A0ABR3VAN7_HUMIN